MLVKTPVVLRRHLQPDVAVARLSHRDAEQPSIEELAEQRIRRRRHDKSVATDGGVEAVPATAFVGH